MNWLYGELAGVLVLQEYVDGVDVTVPVIGRRAPHCLPAVELRHNRPPSGPFVFDAELKDSKASVRYAPIPDWPRAVREHLHAMAVTAFRVAGQRDYARLDCRVRLDGRCFSWRSTPTRSSR